MDFEAFFPFGVASRQSLVAGAFNCAFTGTKFTTAIWRFFLIIFPRTSSYALSKGEWMQHLSDQRNTFEMIRKVPLPQRSPSVNDTILKSLAVSFMSISGKITKEIVSELEQVLVYFIQNDTPEKNIGRISFILVRIYYIFKDECIENDGTAVGFLMDRDFLYHDLFLSLTSILNCIAPFINITNQQLMDRTYDQICEEIQKRYDFQKDVVFPERSNIPYIMNAYTRLFFLHQSQTDSVADLFTALFSYCPQSTIFHVFYAWLFTNRIKDISKIKMKDWVFAVGVRLQIINKYSYQQKLLFIDKKILQIRKLIEKRDSHKAREICKFQLKMIGKVLHDQLYWEEVVPLDQLVKNYLNDN